MKILFMIAVCLVPQIWMSAQTQQTPPDTQTLVGVWKLDMSPYDPSDDNFAMMNIKKVDGNSFEGEFYRKGVKITNASINAQTGVIYGALVSGDGSGKYNSTFYLKDGMLYGTTHALERDFLAVWTGEKIN